MCADPLTTTIISAAASETGKGIAAGMAKKAGDFLSRAAQFPVNKAIADGSAFTDYLQRACASISHAKTLLYRQPTSIESFFEPTDIVVRKGRTSTEVSSEHVSDILKLGDHLIIAGHAGAGKSILMRHLFIDAYRTQKYVPVYVELREMNQSHEDMSLEDLIYQSMRKHGIDFSKEDFVRNLDAQEFLFLLDGLDEVTEARMNKLRDDIQNFGTEHLKAKIILSSRLSDDDFRNWEGFVVANMVVLSKEKAISLINRLELGDQDAKELFAKELEARLYEKHRSFASNPLLLTMMLILFSDRAAIPDDLTEFYSQTFDTLFRRHDAAKSGKYHRELKCGLADADFKRMFSNFCFITFQQDEFGFTRDVLMDRIRRAITRVLGNAGAADANAYLSDLRESVCMLQPDGLQYVFVHRSFQEYFAAIYTMGLNDEDLRRVVVSWLDSSAIINAESSIYLNTLQQLNPDRFERQVVFEVLRELRDSCRKSQNPQYKFLESLYKYIRLEYFEDEDIFGFSFCLRITSLNVISNVLRRTQQIPWGKWISEECPGCRDRLLSYLESMPEQTATFDEIEEAGLADTLLGCTDMGANSIFAAVDRLEEKYAQRSGASVLDNLYDL